MYLSIYLLLFTVIKDCENNSSFSLGTSNFDGLDEWWNIQFGEKCQLKEYSFACLVITLKLSHVWRKLQLTWYMQQTHWVLN